MNKEKKDISQPKKKCIKKNKRQELNKKKCGKDNPKSWPPNFMPRDQVVVQETTETTLPKNSLFFDWQAECHEKQKVFGFNPCATLSSLSFTFLPHKKKKKTKTKESIWRIEGRDTFVSILSLSLSLHRFHHLFDSCASFLLWMKAVTGKKEREDNTTNLHLFLLLPLNDRHILSQTHTEVTCKHSRLGWEEEQKRENTLHLLLQLLQSSLLFHDVYNFVSFPSQWSLKINTDFLSDSFQESPLSL